MTDFDFALGETADMIRDTTRRFAAERIAPLAARIDAEDWFSREELWPAMGELGPHGITVDEADGGLGLGYLGAGYTKDWPVERFLREAKLLDIGAGTNEVGRMLIGRELVGAVERVAQ